MERRDGGSFIFHHHIDKAILRRDSVGTIFISGAARGIGYSVAVHLARLGHTVYALVRAKTRFKDPSGDDSVLFNVNCLKMDLFILC